MPQEVRMSPSPTPIRSLIPFALLLLMGATSRPAMAAMGTVLHEGRLEPRQWSWQAMDGGQRIILADGRALDETDEPALPVRDLLILLPAGTTIAELTIEPLAAHTEDAPGPLALAAPLHTSEGAVVRVDTYPATAGSFPATWGEFRGLRTYRGYVLAAVTVHPFRAVASADGSYRAVEVLDRFAVRAVLTAAGEDGPLRRERLVVGERQRLETQLTRLVANPQALAGHGRQDGVRLDGDGPFLPTPNPSLAGSEVAYLIVTSAALAPAFQRLADHRTAQGLASLVVTREWIAANGRHGVDLQETLRFFLQDAYAKWGLQYVLIGGDTDVIPTRIVRNTWYPTQGFTDIPTDLYYAGLDGNWNANGDGWFGQPYVSLASPGDAADLLPEVDLGRAPASSLAAANAFVDKVLHYENTPANAGWANRALFAAEVLFPVNWPHSPATNDGAAYCEQTIAQSLAPCTSLTTTRMYENLTEYPGSVLLSRAALIDTLNTGHHGIFSQIGHGHYFNMSVGNANFTNSDADGLVNPHYFLLYALNCASGAFDFGCLMERFVQNPHGGSIASIGSAREAFPAASNVYQQGFFAALFCDGFSRVAGAINASRLPYVGNAERNTVDRWTQLNYNLSGDPAVGIWTGTPRAVVIGAPASLAAGTQELVVSVTAGGPVAGALVCARKGDETYAHGVTDAAGTVVLTVAPTSTGNLTVTVTGAGLARTQRQIPVAVPGVYLACEEFIINDRTGQGAANGNDNSVAEAGETIELTLVVRNEGALAASNVVATVTCTDPQVTIYLGTVPVGDIPAGATRNSTQRVIMNLAAGIDDGTFLDLAVSFAAAQGVTSSGHRNLEVEAPQCEPVSIAWSDAVYGNGNGVIENNERIAVTIALKNFGDGRFDAAQLRLRSQSPNAVVVDSVALFGPLDLLQSATCAPALSLRFPNSATIAQSPCMFYIRDNHGRVIRHSFTIDPPSSPDLPAADTTLGADTIALRWSPVAGAGVRGYHVYRAASAGGPFLRVNADLLEGVSYYQDLGLQQLTPYHYRVTAVDSSLVEGASSAVVAATTSPPEVAAFPIPFAVETSGHTAVGDIDGDLDLEVIIAADVVYAWHANGVEVIDGDGDAQTNGPLTGVAGQFDPAGVTLANLDGEPGAEIIVSERANGYQIHIYKADGTMLPGWPQTLSMWNWTTPAVGDLDGDGDLEIVVNTENGRTYAWHHDGTEVRDGDNNASTNGVFLVRPESWGYSSPAICDLDGDGRGDIIFGTSYWNNQNGLLAYRYDGTPVAGFPYLTGTSRIICAPAIGDLDGNGNVEIVFFDVDHKLHVVRQNGAVYPGFPITRTAPWDDSPGPSPALANLDDDPGLEIVWPINGGGHRCDLVVVDTGLHDGTSGQVLAGWPVQLPGNTESSPVVGDLNGDGRPDIVLGIGGGSTEAPNNLYAFEANGELLNGFPITLGGPIRATPVLCDLDGDGNINIVCGSWDRQLHVWSMPYAYERSLVPWPTFHGNMHRDGVLGDPLAVPVPEVVPASFAALPPYPNPFNPQATLRLYVPAGTQDQRVEVGVFDLRGRRVRGLQGGPLPAGWHDFTWDGRDDAGRAQASGVYVWRTVQGASATSYKTTLVK
jgi:hypothetical protein